MADPQLQDHLSLEQIEKDYWGDPPADATRLIATIHRLRHKPIGSLDAEDLRILLSQQEGIEILIPRAVTRLEQDPLLEGDFYPGDVLVAVLKAAAESYWRAHPEQLARLERVITAARNLGALDNTDDPDDLLKRRVHEFHQRIRP